MSKYPYFGKKGRPTKEEADLCKKINRLVNSGEVSESEINQLIQTDGIPTNLDELQDMYSYLTGVEVKRTSNKLYTGEEEEEEDYEEEDYEDDYEDEKEINMSESFNNVSGKKDAVGFDPFSEPVIERAYTKGINSSNEEEENDVEFDENDFEQPKGGENVADKINSGNSISEEQGEEDIPEPEWAKFDETG